MQMYKYEIIIYWSNEDSLYIAEVPELAGCSAHGHTSDKALHNANDAITLWIETAKKYNDLIPSPKGRKLVLA